MLDTPLVDSIMATIHRHSGEQCHAPRLSRAGGGSISQAFIVETRHGRWFVKLNDSARLDMFVAEAEGLNALASCTELRVPRVIGTGCCGQQAFLVLEHVSMQPLIDGNASIAAGRALAALHRIENREFGWDRDNFIGSTPQANRYHADWSEFFARERLLPQLRLAQQNGCTGVLISNGERLAEKLSAFFAAYRPLASMLHGDLWHGNAALDETGTLVLFDPAVYFGDRETDLAMCELFGGFPSGFIDAYRETWPLAEGYPQRKMLYNLYHILNHLNLFGGSYRHQAERMAGTLLAELA